MCSHIVIISIKSESRRFLKLDLIHYFFVVAILQAHQRASDAFASGKTRDLSFR